MSFSIRDPFFSSIFQCMALGQLRSHCAHSVDKIVCKILMQKEREKEEERKKERKRGGKKKKRKKEEKRKEGKDLVD